ncbi:MAG: secretin N-terminal domain-containing protein [Planctomycetota bacterium]
MGLCLAALFSQPVRAQSTELEPETGSEVRSGGAGGVGGGIVTIIVENRPLEKVLAVLMRASGYNIRAAGTEEERRKINEMKITLHLERAYWRDVLSQIARDYQLEIDDSLERRRIINILLPKQVSHIAKDEDIRDVVSMIAMSAGLNVVMGESVSGKVTINLENIPGRDALDIVARAAQCVLVPEKRGVIRIARPAELETQMETRVFLLAYIQAEGSRYRATITSDVAETIKSKPGEGQMSLKDVLEKVKSTAGTVAMLRGQNSLIVTDTPQKLKVVEGLVNQLDRPPKQVHLSLKLIELSDSDAESIGMKWQNGLTAEASGMSFPTAFPFSTGPASSSLSGTIPGDMGLLVPKDGGPVGLGSGLWTTEQAIGEMTLGTLSFTKLQALLQFIRTSTKGRIVQAPQLIALDHEEATIHVGESVRYAESFVQNTEGGGQASGYREARNSPVRLGIQVLVIPHVTGPDNNVILTVIPKTEKASPRGLFETFEGGATLGQLKLPQTVQQTVVTKMMLRDRETGIIAGLREQSTHESITKIPFLGDLPLIGWLFRHRERSADLNKNTNLLILITPTVIDFEKRSDIGEMEERAREEHGKGFSLEEETAPVPVGPGVGGPLTPSSF